MAMICAALAAGCTVGGSQQTPAANTSEDAAASADAVPRMASIPALEFVVVSALPSGAKIKPGSTLPAKSYKPVLTGDHITSVQWVVGEAEGINRIMLSLQFDAKGTRDFAYMIASNADKDVLFVLNHKVVSTLAIYESVSPGAVTIGSPRVLAARSAIDSATVPSR